MAAKMKNTTFIKYDKAAGRESLFFGDPQADFYVLFAGKLYNLRKQFLSSSSYFARKILKNHKVHVIDCSFKSSTFQKILSCFYGLKCIFERSIETDQIMEVIKFLECKDLQELLRKQIIKNFNEYDIFFLLNFSNKYHDNQLQVLCEEELVKQNFQQLNFNRFELLKSKEEVFKNLIKLHQKLKTARTITGLTFQEIRKLILEYNTANSTSVDLLTILVLPLSSIIMEDPEGEKESPLPQVIKKIKKHQTVDLSSSCATQPEECPGIGHLRELDLYLSESCGMEKRNVKRKSELIETLNNQQSKIRENKAVVLMISEMQTQPQESLNNSERTTVLAINDTIKLEQQRFRGKSKPQINEFLKKKRSGSTSFVDSVNLIKLGEFENEIEKRPEKCSDSEERLIKSQIIGESRHA